MKLEQTVKNKQEKSQKQKKFENFEPQIFVKNYIQNKNYKSYLSIQIIDVFCQKALEMKKHKSKNAQKSETILK